MTHKRLLTSLRDIIITTYDPIIPLGDIFISTLHRKELRHREFKWLAKSHTQSQNPKPRSLAPASELFDRCALLLSILLVLTNQTASEPNNNEKWLSWSFSFYISKTDPYKVKYWRRMPTNLLTTDHRSLWKKAKPKLYVKVMETETLKVVPSSEEHRVKSWVLRKIYASNILINLK